MQKQNNSNYVDGKRMSGALPIKLTNDFFFKYLQEADNNILSSIVNSFIPFHIQVCKLEITNPIDYSKQIDSKTMILDVKAFLNDDSYVNLEMQVVNNHDWPERSLSYLTRGFDNLKHGELYSEVRRSYHIGFLNFTQFPDDPQFCSEYQFLNIHTRKPLTSKIGMTMVDLTKVDLATDEDRLYERDLWAKFFMATTWEDLYMLAEKKPIFEAATVIVREVSEEERLRQLYEAREDQLRQQLDFHKYYNDLINEKDKQLADKAKQLADKDELLADKDERLTSQAEQLADRDARIAELERMLSDSK